MRRSAFLPHSTDICWLHIHTHTHILITNYYTYTHIYICIHFPNPDPSPPSLWPASLTSGSVTSAAGLAAGPDGCLLELDCLPCCKVVCLWCIMCFCCWGVFPVLTLYSPRSIVWGLFFSSSLSSCCYAVFFFKNPCISLLIVLCMIVYVTNKPTLTLTLTLFLCFCHGISTTLFPIAVAMFPLIFFLAEQNFSLLGGHFGHLSKNILYTLYSAHTKKCVTFNFNVLFIFDLTLDITKWCTFLVTWENFYLFILFFTV